MVQINFGRKEVSCKVVFYGPGMSGKTTNLEIVHQKVPEQNRGDLTSISTDGDRTLFFDYMPLDLGSIAGMHTKFQLYTVPGQVYYNSTRKLVLQGVDGVVFVADSSPNKRKENLESLKNLVENLREYGKELKDTPHVIQFNKRDLPDAMPAAEMAADLNAHGAPYFEAVAATGQGVFPTLKALASLVLETVNRSGMRGPAGATSVRAVGAPAVTVPAAAASAASVAGVGGGSPFTRTAPPGTAKGFAAAGAAAPAEAAAHESRAAVASNGPAPAAAPLPHLMGHGTAAAPAGASSPSAPLAAPAPAARPRAPLPSPVARPAAGAKPAAAKKPAKKKGNHLGFALLFGGLVLAAAGGILFLLLS